MRLRSRSGCRSLFRHPTRTMIVQTPRPLSARDVRRPSSLAAAWIVDGTGALAFVTRTGAHDAPRLPDGFRAEEISFGADRTLWVLATGGGRQVVFRRRPGSDSLEIVPVAVPLSRIAGAPDGTLWMVSARGEVLLLEPGAAECRRSPAGEEFATEISAGADGSVWIVSTVTRAGGRIVRRRDGADGFWRDLPAPAAATRVAVAPDGMAWTVNARGVVWRLHPEGGGNLAECQVDTACSECRFSAAADSVREISVGPDGSVWVLAVRDSNPTLMLLTDPLARRYVIVPTPQGGVRVAGALARPVSAALATTA
jgi:streptogramin lyase